MPGESYFTINVSTSSKTQLKDVTDKISDTVKESGIKNGVCHLFVPHTTAAVTINENADPDVVSDFIEGISNIVPSNLHYRHSEGNSPAHIKCSLVGCSERVFVEEGRLVLGTWQGIYFCEFDGPRSRKLHIKVVEA